MGIFRIVTFTLALALSLSLSPEILVVGPGGSCLSVNGRTIHTSGHAACLTTQSHSAIPNVAIASNDGVASAVGSGAGANAAGGEAHAIGTNATAISTKRGDCTEAIGTNVLKINAGNCDDVVLD